MGGGVATSFMLQVVMAHVGWGWCGWIGNGEGEEVVMDELAWDLWDNDYWFLGEGDWSFMAAGVGWVCAIYGDIWFFHWCTR